MFPLGQTHLGRVLLPLLATLHLSAASTGAVATTAAPGGSNATLTGNYSVEGAKVVHPCTSSFKGERCLFFSDHSRALPELEQLVAISVGLAMVVVTLVVVACCVLRKRCMKSDLLVKLAPESSTAAVSASLVRSSARTAEPPGMDLKRGPSALLSLISFVVFGPDVLAKSVSSGTSVSTGIDLCEAGFYGPRCGNLEFVIQPVTEEQIVAAVFCVSLLLIGLAGALFFFYKWYKKNRLTKKTGLCRLH
ncbi:hypothetical protein fugu_003732 [Takifugu bimaculatus]|uniref:EGF-like domain-containing protein n=1 Tax=Takifugu bimaculatus TaxID=433685 RepID=A0A4Z2BCY2_9TELE|nr:hypothetical protein fugu_003732 [Takifugu bimaculatus]